MSDEAKTIREALVLKPDGVTDNAPIIRAAQALDTLESQNQALQERIEELETAIRDFWVYIEGAPIDEYRDQLLSPTQETDRE
jgi:hypothetical protein